MAANIYEIPETVEQLFDEVENNGGVYSYRIIDYTDGMNMDNNESLRYFIECVGITSDLIEEDYGSQITLVHPNYKQCIVIDSGGLGDFYSHGFDCSTTEN
ncbi:hypothetical protein LCM23_25275 [Cytobacillus kochii]|uniref:hypothetical protein n=1 Tax=Cytobacillus kochii TaxID=859143 RepID=UPI001CD70E4A|nr:hypothetical protein [Cytobacillus kochii]MCA1029328.1 hypothetical protein [Cytobacillus kochii]